MMHLDYPYFKMLDLYLQNPLCNDRCGHSTLPLAKSNIMLQVNQHKAYIET